MEEPRPQPPITYSYDPFAPLSLPADSDHPALYVYDSLPSLTLTLTPTPTPTPTASSSVDPDPPASYAVYRNQITDVAGESMGVSATDFFSLDVVAPTSAPASPSNDPLVGNSSSDEPECSEKAWFTAGRRFRSPMLQLHRGSFLVLVILLGSGLLGFR